MALPDIEDMEEKDVIKLAEICLEKLSLDAKVGVVVRVFGDQDEKEELLMWLNEEESDPDK